MPMYTCNALLFLFSRSITKPGRENSASFFAFPPRPPPFSWRLGEKLFCFRPESTIIAAVPVHFVHRSLPLGYNRKRRAFLRSSLHFLLPASYLVVLIEMLYLHILAPPSPSSPFFLPNENTPSKESAPFIEFSSFRIPCFLLKMPYFLLMNTPYLFSFPYSQLKYANTGVLFVYSVFPISYPLGLSKTLYFDILSPHKFVSLFFVLWSQLEKAIEEVRLV